VRHDAQYTHGSHRYPTGRQRFFDDQRFVLWLPTADRDIRFALCEIEHALRHQKLDLQGGMARMENVKHLRRHDEMRHAGRARQPDGASYPLVE